MSANSLPTLLDPQDLFLHLLVYASVPALVAVMTALTASYSAVMGWIGFGRTTVRIGLRTRDKVQQWTSEQTRSLITLVRQPVRPEIMEVVVQRS